MSARYPFTFHPRGWFQLGYSDELGPGAVQPLSAFGRELVLYRGEDGQPHLLDAYCPHLGAHLGHGGKVRGALIECPFHGWRLDGAGACVEIPHAKKIPPGAAIRSWPVRERSGVLLAYHGPAGADPAWQVPDFPELGSSEWTPPARKKWRIRVHAQEIAENLVDPMHFRYVHQTLAPAQTRVEVEGHLLRSFSIVQHPTPRGPVEGRIDGEAHGLALWLIRWSGIVDLVHLTSATPVDGEHVDLRVTFTVRRNPERPGAEQNVGNKLIAEICRQVEEDIPIWEHKLYRDRPAYSEGDGAISALRKWSRQFLEE